MYTHKYIETKHGTKTTSAQNECYDVTQNKSAAMTEAEEAHFDSGNPFIGANLMFPILNGIVKTGNESHVDVVEPKSLDILSKHNEQVLSSDSLSDAEQEDVEQNYSNQLLRLDGSSNQPQANINIENSTDVVIGPVTRFHGPVTIYQNLQQSSNVKCDSNNKKEVPNGSPSHGILDSASRVDENGKCSFLANSFPEKAKDAPDNSTTESRGKCPLENIFKNQLNFRRLYLVIVAIIVIIFSITFVSVTLLLDKSEDVDHEARTEVPAVNNTEGNHNETGRIHRIITRNEWGAKLPNSMEPLQNPVGTVVIAHTASKECKSVSECSVRVRDIQSQHLNQNYQDIGYNFLIGGDGNIYVGTGWSVKSQHKDFILLSFIGNYVQNELDENIIKAAQFFLDEGALTNMLTEKYKLLAHNQTMATVSPGKNVFKVIKYWDHFSLEKIY